MATIPPDDTGGRVKEAQSNARLPTCIVCGRVFTTVKGMRTHKRMLGHKPDDSCRLCGVDLNQALRKPSDKAHREYYCLQCSRERDKKYSRKYNKTPKAHERQRAYFTRLKLFVLSYYSPQLVCQCSFSRCWHIGACRVSDPRILCIDHIDGGGNRHRKSITTPFYNWLKKNGFPTGFQVLCQNCNWMKAHENRESSYKGYSVGNGTRQFWQV